MIDPAAILPADRVPVVIFDADNEPIFASVIAALAIIAVLMNPSAIVSLSLVIDPAAILPADRVPVVILAADRLAIFASVIAALAIIAVVIVALSILVWPVMCMRLPSIRMVSGEMLIWEMISPERTRRFRSPAIIESDEARPLSAFVSSVNRASLLV